MPLDMSGHTELRTINELDTFLKNYGHGLRAEFGMTHLTALADKFSTAWGLKEDHEKITGQELLEAMHDDLTSPYHEYMNVKSLITTLNYTTREQDYKTFKENQERRINRNNSLPNTYTPISYSTSHGLITGVLAGMLTSVATTPLYAVFGVSGIILPALAVMVGFTLGGAYIGSLIKKNKIKKLDQKKQRELAQIDQSFKEHKLSWDNLHQKCVDELLAPDFNVNNDEKQPRITFEPEAITRVRFTHRAPSI